MADNTNRNVIKTPTTEIIQAFEMLTAIIGLCQHTKCTQYGGVERSPRNRGGQLKATVILIVLILADFVQLLLHGDLIIAIEAPPAPTQVQQRPDQIFLRAAGGGKFQVKLSTKLLVIFISLAPEHDLRCICTMFQGVAFLACHG